MKANISNSMQHIRMLRGELWVNKGIIPAILREVFETTSSPSPIIGAFNKCWIAPLCQDAISVELVTTSPPVGREAIEANHQDEGTVIVELTLDVSRRGNGHRRADAGCGVSITGEGTVIAELTLDVSRRGNGHRRADA